MADRISVTPAQQFRKEHKSVQYQLRQIIGRGSYGVVYKATNKKTAQEVAIKEVNYQDDDELVDIMSEIDLLKNLNHINIVKYHGFIQKQHNLYIILEYCAKGSLKNLISRNRPMSEHEAKPYVRQTLNGLNYLHEQGVIHRDIKAANILLDAENVVKLADFGVSTKVNNTAMTLAGSLNWMAPEIIGNRGASTLSDIWSLGATVVELLTGNPPFHNLIDMNIYYAIENDSYFPPSSLSSGAKDFLQQCFAKNMYKRPTAVQLLQHNWLENDNSKDSTMDKQVIPSVEKLNLYQEKFEDSDLCWDDDFEEKDLNLSSPSKKDLVKTKIPSDEFIPDVLNISEVNQGNQGNQGNDPIKNEQARSNNNIVIQSQLERSSTPITMDRNKGNADLLQNSSLDEDNLLQIVKSGKSIENVGYFFQKCSIDMLALTLIELTMNKKDMIREHLAPSNHELNLYKFFEYDEKKNKSKLKRKFIQLGGLPSLFHYEKLLSIFFVDDFVDDLIRAGIIPYVRDYKNGSLVLSIINKHMELMSIQSWCKWCNFNLPIDIILENLIARKAQSILLKISTYGSKEFKLEILKNIVNYNYNSSNQKILLDSQVMYVIFKSVFYILRSLHLNSGTSNNSAMLLNFHSHHISTTGSNTGNTPSLSSSPTKSPVSSWKTQSPPLSPTRTLSGKSQGYPSGVSNPPNALSSNNNGFIVPENVFLWMEEFLRSKYFCSLMDIHVWKYFNRAFYYTTYNNKPRLLKLLADDCYTRFCIRVADTVSDKNGRQVMGQASLVLMRMSNELLSSLHNNQILSGNKNISISPSLITIATKFLGKREFIYEGIEIVLNCIQFISHQNEDTGNVNTFNRRGNQRNRNGERLMVLHSDKLLFSEENVLVDMNDIVDCFFIFPENDSNFGNYVVKFMKLCMVQQLEYVCQRIVLKEQFYERIVAFFGFYCNSLLIQIDLLKLVKTLFTRALHSNNERSNILDSLKTLLAFLSENWDPLKGNNKGQVGYNSVLIKQLCSDIAALLSYRPNTKRSNGLDHLGVSQFALDKNITSSGPVVDRGRLPIPRPEFNT
ncbi:Cell division control protein 15 [Nakaseomyces glabratus]|uniref:non-specific serine/threonine protein kinase n=1 Tax=Candida glabrata TaxID=5478 RepID=A0A0W0C9C4_CANGB|nr:Cell division control protein 15 [Nakaseomyces glabratus]KTA99346.1 Cell division control protein 15 [Nakaseomyces glabratus]KTB01771.1 Cell division control protein 15 [Nakaseomyces glabratus]KTB17946.1 Cell division control protein 15 [Nakaseomyces glabratus]